jgi:hypothetical protein
MHGRVAPQSGCALQPRMQMLAGVLETFVQPACFILQPLGRNRSSVRNSSTCLTSRLNVRCAGVRYKNEVTGVRPPDVAVLE